jgi:hypothetical protein
MARALVKRDPPAAEAVRDGNAALDHDRRSATNMIAHGVQIHDARRFSSRRIKSMSYRNRPQPLRRRVEPRFEDNIDAVAYAAMHGKTADQSNQVVSRQLRRIGPNTSVLNVPSIRSEAADLCPAGLESTSSDYRTGFAQESNHHVPKRLVLQHPCNPICHHLLQRKR